MSIDPQSSPSKFDAPTGTAYRCSGRARLAAWPGWHFATVAAPSCCG